MARTKNRGYQQTLTPTYTARLWKMGGYIRLSREDLQKINRGLDDSNSVKNQRDILNDFHNNHMDEFESYTEYVDDGHTGTDTERESFQRLLGDVMSGKINCVVVKDLSRFARNYSDAGSLIDNLFVQMGVRFISLAEGVDSYLNPDMSTFTTTSGSIKPWRTRLLRDLKICTEKKRHRIYEKSCV